MFYLISQDSALIKIIFCDVRFIKPLKCSVFFFSGKITYILDLSSTYWIKKYLKTKCTITNSSFNSLKVKYCD